MLICLPVMLPQTTILVTGAAGALGRVVFASLQREGYRVPGFDRLGCPWSDPMDWVTGALQSAQDCQRALQGVGIVIHLAAVPDDAPFESDLMPSNILGLHYLLEAAKESGVQRILMASTRQVVWEPLNHGPRFRNGCDDGASGCLPSIPRTCPTDRCRSDRSRRLFQPGRFDSVF